MNSLRALCALVLFSVGAFAQNIVLPNALNLQAIDPNGVGFTYNGSLTQAATVSLTVSGLACLQSGSTYCTNGAGVVVVAGSSPVGATTTFTGTVGVSNKLWNYGSLVMSISGVGSVQLFPASSANGLGSSNPASSLTLPPTSLSALGFSNFTASNPTITFYLADNQFNDNSGSMTISPGQLSGTPIPSSLLLTLCGILALATAAGWRAWMVRA